LAVLPLVIAGAIAVAGHQPQKFSANGIAFEVPSSWHIYDKIPPTTGMGQLFVIVGTTSWGPCDEYDINCHFSERFNRQEIEVQVAAGYQLGDGFCAFARTRPDMDRDDGVRVTETHYLRIDGRPAISTTYSLDSPDYYLANGWKEWKIAARDSTEAVFDISARWRGPGDDAFLAELDRMIASIRLGASAYGSSSAGDCGDPFPAAAG
jgi:hypothetical protein